MAKRQIRSWAVRTPWPLRPSDFLRTVFYVVILKEFRSRLLFSTLVCLYVLVSKAPGQSAPWPLRPSDFLRGGFYVGILDVIVTGWGVFWYNLNND